MKALVIGASLTGKTAVVKYLRSNTDIPLSEMDEELTNLNKGKYPTDDEYKHKVLAPKIIKDALNRERIVFFTNTDYFTWDDLRKAKDKGFKIIQLELDIDELKKRNKHRVKNAGYDDLSKWFKGMLQYQEQIKEAGIVDITVQADEPVEKIAKEIKEHLKQVGLEAYRQVFLRVYGDSPKEYIISYTFSNESFAYFLGAYVDDSEIHIELIEKVLSTFKFTN